MGIMQVTLKKSPGRPAVYANAVERKAANAQAARLYRQKKKGERDARLGGGPLRSSVIDLSEIAIWRRG